MLLLDLMGCSSTKQYVILVLVGSARSQSINNSLVKQIQSFRVDNNMHLKLIIPDLQKLPLFSLDIENKIFLPNEIKILRERAQKADAVILITPEYNGSVSPLILNAFVWLSRSYSQRGSPIRRKKAGVISASYLSQNQIVDCIELGRHFDMNFFKDSFYLFLGNKIANQQGKLTSAYEKGRLQDWYKQFLNFVMGKTR